MVALPIRFLSESTSNGKKIDGINGKVKHAVWRGILKGRHAVIKVKQFQDQDPVFFKA